MAETTKKKRYTVFSSPSLIPMMMPMSASVWAWMNGAPAHRRVCL